MHSILYYVISSTESVNQPSNDSSDLDVEFEASVNSSDLNAESPKIPSPGPESDAPPAVPEHGALHLHSYKRKAESPPGQTQLSKGNDSCSYKSQGFLIVHIYITIHSSL